MGAEDRMHTDKQNQQQMQRFKITLNRSNIINIEAIQTHVED
jgi:hypothetical protein